MQAGSFVSINWPHSDTGGGKPRPGLVVTGPDAQGDVVLLKVTGNPSYEGAIKVENSDLSSGALKKVSYVRIDRFLSVNTGILEYSGTRLGVEKLKEENKALILHSSRRFSSLAHSSNLPGDHPDHPYNNPATRNSPPDTQISVPYAGRVFDTDEVEAAVSSTLDFWLTLGKEGDALSEELAAFLGVKHSILTNSGSSANLLAVSALTSHKLPKHKRLQPGDEVITCAAGFPTTVAPILQNGLVPVFIDNDPITGNARVDQLEAAYVKGKTKAVMFAHTLGNPFDLGAVCAFCHKHDLWLIEDNCDALGCTYTLPVTDAKAAGLDHLIKIAEKGDHPLIKITHSNSKLELATSSPHSNSKLELLTAPTGTFGDLSTQSFYPPHHLTMGEGGAINVIRRPQLKMLVESFRDWGRDCWCASGIDNTCGKRFGWQLGELPEGYDHKYIYSHMGYNLKPLDPQAAIGRQQVKKLPAFIQARKDNWEYLRAGLAGLESVFEFCLPTHGTEWSEQGFSWDSSGHSVDCSWFGFMLLVKPGAPFTKSAFAKHLDDRKIGNRMLFGGNLLRQPAFVQLKKDRPEALRVIGEMHGADRIMNEAVFIGVYPGLTTAQLDYMISEIRSFVEKQ